MNKWILFIGVFITSNQLLAQLKKASISVIFETIANGKKVVLKDNSYTNSFNENYTITKLKYYVSNMQFVYSGKNTVAKSVHLINASVPNTISLPYQSKKIIGLSFLLGVDSVNNCSGAQSGALDPLNDMFWTWNNGYVMFKLEGRSDSSKADNNRIEHHIGGYKGAYKTMREIFLPINSNYFKKNKKITVQLNMDKYWKGVNELRINENPLITTTGMQAKKAADNFEGMFLLKK